MAVLREVLARFGIDVDASPLGDLSSGIDGVVGRMRNLGTVLAAGLAVNQIRAFTEEMAHASEEVRQQAARLGLSTDAMQEFAFAARAAGRDTDDMVDAMSTLQERARDAVLDPQSDPARQLRLLGVSARDSSGELKSAEVLIGEVADGLAGMSNQTDRVGAAMTLFGDVGRELLPVLQNGSEGLGELRERARELGGGFSEAAIAGGQELTQAMNELDTVVLSLKARLATVLFPIVARSVDRLVDFSEEFLRLAENSHIVEAALLVLGAAAIAFGIKFLAGFAGPIAIAAVFAIAIGFIILLVDDLITLFNGGTSVIGAFIDGLFGVGTAAQFVQDLKDAWEGLVFAIQQASDAIRRFNGEDVPERTLSGRADTEGLSPEEIQLRQIRNAALQGQVRGLPGESFEDALARFNDTRRGAIASGEIEANPEDVQAGLAQRVGRVGEGQGRVARGGRRGATARVERRGGGSAGSTVDARTEAVINVPPGTDRRQLQAIRNAVGQVMDERNRAAAAALAEEAVPAEE